MKKLTLLKTFLMAVCLLVGGSAWAETVGNVDNSSSGDKSTVLTLNNGGTVHYEFTATNDEADNGHGWILVANNGSSDIVRLRCDNWELVAAANTGCFSNYDWNTFRADMNGSTVNMDVTLASNVLTISSTITKEAKEYTYRYMKYLDTAPASLDICLEVANAYLNITTGTSTDNQFEVKTPVFGSISGSGVAVENFSSATAESDIIKNWVGATITNVTSSIGLGNVTEVAKVAENTAYGTGVKPTYVSGNCIELTSTYSNNNGNSGNKVVSYGTYEFTPVSSGYFVFNGDSYRSTDGNTNHPHEIAFLDGDGNNVLRICYNNANNGVYLLVYNSEGDISPYHACVSYMRGFTAFGISGLVIDMSTGNCIMTVDYSQRGASNDIATRKIDKFAFNIGTGKNIAKLELGRQNQNGANVTFKTYLDNVSLYQIGTTAVEYDYTINYKVNGVGDNVKTTAGKSTTLGETINAETVFWVGDVKYVLNGAQTTSMNITAGTNVLNINVKECDKYNYTLRAKNSTTVLNSNIWSGWVYAEETANYRIPRYVLYNHAIYETTSYYGSFVPTSDGEIKDIAYEKNIINNVDYYFEGEDITGVSVSSNSYASQQRMGYTGGDSDFKEVTDIAPGKYKIFALGHNGNASSRNPKFKVGDTEVFTFEIASGNNRSATSDEFTVASTSKLSFGCSGSSVSGVDFFYLIRTDVDYVTVSAAGFATYVNSEQDLNFTDTDIKAYKVKVSTKGVATLTQVDNVPAGTPVLLYKDGGATEDIPVMTGAAAVTENDLVAGTNAEVATIDGEYTNMILNYVDSKIGFYYAAGNTVAANRAYLHILTTLAPDAESEARMVMIFADDETTGISDASRLMDNGKMRNDNFFNLNGQRVEKPVKGLYIVNGKKVVIK